MVEAKLSVQDFKALVADFVASAEFESRVAGEAVPDTPPTPPAAVSGVSQDDVVWCYQHLLGRQPESDSAVQIKMGAPHLKALVADMVSSPEFEARIAKGQDPAPRRFLQIRPMAVDTEATAEQLSACLRVMRETWSHLGNTRPHYSVLTQDRFLPDRIEDSSEEFWSSGKAEANWVVAKLRAMGMDGFENKICVEYGCGVGRVTLGLAEHFSAVHGYDISPDHLAVAADKARNRAVRNVFWDPCTGGLLAPLQPCDVFFSRLVFQHNPPPVMVLLIRKCLAALKAGGIAIFQVPTYGVGYHFDLAKWLKVDHGRDIQMHCLPQRKVLELIREAHCELLEVTEDNATGAPELYVSNTFVARRGVAEEFSVSPNGPV